MHVELPTLCRSSLFMGDEPQCRLVVDFVHLTDLVSQTDSEALVAGVTAPAGKSLQ